MKELTTEQKAQRYDEAIEKARIWKDKSGMPKDKQGILDTIFPELAESEDEKIRKELIAFLKYYHTGQENCVVYDDDWIAWLEKQGEQKPVEDKIWSIYDAKDGDVLNSVRVQATIIFKGFADDDKHILAYCGLQKGIFISQEILWDRDFEPASEYWKNALYDAMTARGYEWDADRLELKKIEPKQEWSEEDERTYKSITYSFANNYPLTVQQQEFVKSLKDRYTWKPSESDIRILEQVIDGTVNPINYHATLYAILEQLKKLKG